MYDVEGSTRSCWTGSWVSPCAILLRRVGFWVAACCGYCSPLGMTCQWARSPLEERVYRGAGRSRRRARGDGVLVWSGVASPVFVGARFWVSSRERGRSPSFFLGQSLAPPLVCKKLRVCRRTHRHGGYYYYVIAPGSGRGRARPQLAPPSSQCESCAFPSCSRDLPLSRSARAPPRPSRSTSRTVVSLNRGSRILGFDTGSGLRK